jgi:L-ascorbate metabolism protein UlaG (beta-lactamase superfamily)
MSNKLTLVSCVVLLTAGCGSSSSTNPPDSGVAHDSAATTPDAPTAPDAPAASDASVADAPVSFPDGGNSDGPTADATAADAPAPVDGASIDAADGAAAADATAAAAGVQTFDTDMGPLKMTPIKHASVMFEWNGLVVYVDPAMAPANAGFDGRPAADVILISHKHGDHLAPANIDKLRKATTKLFGPASVAAMPAVTGMTVMNNGDNQTVGALQIHALGAYNLTAERLMNHPMGEGNGYVLTFGSKKVFVSGDTECVPDIKALTGIDVALLCMNLPYTMSVAEAAVCAKTFSPKILYPYHYSNSDVSVLPAMVGASSEVRLLNWYPQ